MEKVVDRLLPKPEGSKVGLEELGVSVNGFWVSLWNNENLLKLFVIIGTHSLNMLK